MVSSFQNCDKAYSLISVSSHNSSRTKESATIGSKFPSTRLFGVWSKVVFGLRKHNLASTPNNVFRGSPLSALKSPPSLIGLVLMLTIYATASFIAKAQKKDRHDGRPIIYNTVWRNKVRETEADGCRYGFPPFV